MKTLIIIPAYNEAENIKRVVDNLIDNYPQYDYIVVNDGSRDDTKKICKENRYNLLDCPVNLGLAGAVQTGFVYAYENGYDAALQFDGDGQHQPQFIADMLPELEKHDIVIGSRFVTERKPKSLRMLGSNVIQLCIKITTGVKIMDPTSGMRMFNRSTIKECAININYGPEPDTVSFLMKNGAKVAEVQAEMDERIAGESYLNAIASIIYMARMMTSIIVIQNFRKRDRRFIDVSN